MQVDWTETELGFTWENKSLIVFFGKKEASLGAVRKAYPRLDIYTLHQVHGDKVVESIKADEKADAHWTRTPEQALAIQTADCTPVFLYSEKEGIVGAAHAGWRGLASQIISKLALQLAYKGAQLRELEVFVGPHIQMQSFEVDGDVRAEIIGAVPHMNDKDMRKSELYKELDNGKTLIDLAQIAGAQLRNVAIPETSIHWLKADTKTDERFHSFRRDKDKAGRQLSFIALKP